MKVAVACQSPLLQKSLEIFLGRYLSSLKRSDIIIRDELCLEEEERCFYIASDEKADLVKPFSKAQLILALERKYKELQAKTTSPKQESVQESMDFTLLEQRIEALTKEYQANILRTIKAFYEE
ncbi:JHP0747 family [hydrothermal vent metagenome]|uniref:JHP0747 family n=1 Tax=hydrothermal vent metagenome TaxID=652676 RepID=A0A1W1CWB2_9ZZZZ